MERLTKRDSGGNAVVDCDVCELGESRLANCGVLKCRNRLKDRLAYYEDAEEQGRLIVPPNAEIGKTLFYVINGKIYEGALYRVSYVNYNGKIHTDVSAAKGYNSFGSRFEDFGKTVFLSREEAEKALEGMKCT